MTGGPTIQQTIDGESSAIIAPMMSRLIAVFIDYLVLMSFSILSVRLVNSPDQLFIPNFILSGLYLGLGSSRISNGQTLGKKAFRLRVVSTAPGGQSAYLTAAGGLLRYFGLIGLLILLSDVPPLIYRQIGFSADPMLLEVHMLAALIYTISGVTLVLLSTSHRGLHDLLAGSIVVRSSPNLAPGSGREVLAAAIAAGHNRSAAVLAPLAGVVFGILLWMRGAMVEPQVSQIIVHRYAIESRYPVRIQGLMAEEQSAAIALEVSPRYSQTGGALPESAALAADLANYFREEKYIDPALVKEILFIFSRIVPKESTGLSFTVERVKVETSTLTTNILPEQF